MEIQEPRRWLADNRILVSVVAVGVLLLAVSFWWRRGRQVDITSSMSRANCASLYQRARTGADSELVDGHVASVGSERRLGYLQPDVRCGEIRAYDSSRAAPSR